jgi:hypothetical protein
MSQRGIAVRPLPVLLAVLCLLVVLLLLATWILVWRLHLIFISVLLMCCLANGRSHNAVPVAVLCQLHEHLANSLDIV